MHSERLLDHFRNPRNQGRLDPPAVQVLVTNPVCGDVLELSALIENGVVARAAFRVRGCTASIAAGSALTVLIAGRDAAGLASLPAEEVEAALDGLAPGARHAAALAAEGARALAALAAPSRREVG
jgi:nitrogen fixation NifU-like protein